MAGDSAVSDPFVSDRISRRKNAETFFFFACSKVGGFLPVPCSRPWGSVMIGVAFYSGFSGVAAIFFWRGAQTARGVSTFDDYPLAPAGRRPPGREIGNPLEIDNEIETRS